MNLKTTKYLTLALLLTIFLFTRASSALNVLFDLENLKNQNPSLVAAYDKIDIFRAWKTVLDSGTTFAERTRIGILDTGIDLSHREFIKTVVDADVTSDLKKDGHGTQVAGIIGADNKSPAPVDSLEMNGLISGATDKYTLISRQVIRKKGFNIVAAIENMVTEKSPHIVNISAGATRCSAKSLLGQFTNCISDKDFDNNKRIWNTIFSKSSSTLFVVGSGNDGVDSLNTLPAAIDLNNVMTVAATDLDDKRANFPFPARSSNFGAVVDISAPGVNVYSPRPGGDYDKNFSGTSASTPLVTGVAGLIKAIKPNLAPAQIKDILVRNADPITTDKPIGGRLNALKAVCDPLVLNCTPPTPPSAFLQLTNTAFPARNFSPTISRDGAKIAFYSEANLAGLNPTLATVLFVMNSDGTGLKRIASNLIFYWSAPPSLNFDGSRVAFYAYTSLGEKAIYVANTDGSLPTKLISVNTDGVVMSGDGSTIAYSSFSTSTTKIFAVNSDGTNSRLLVEGGNVWPPTGHKWQWCQDRICFCRIFGHATTS